MLVIHDTGKKIISKSVDQLHREKKSQAKPAGKNPEVLFLANLDKLAALSKGFPDMELQEDRLDILNRSMPDGMQLQVDRLKTPEGRAKTASELIRAGIPLAGVEKMFKLILA